MVCQICRHPARETNHQLIQQTWADGGSRSGPQLGAYDAYTYCSRIRQMTGIYATYPCGFCVPGLDLVAPPQPTHYIRPREHEPPFREEAQDGQDNLHERKLTKPVKASPASKNRDLAFALSQENKLSAACVRESVNAVKSCYTAASGKEIAEAAAAALAATALKGSKLTARVAAVDTTIIAGAELSKHEACKNASRLLLGEDCMRRNLPKGGVLAETIFKGSSKK